jgi:arylsulfatase A-like enzyme
MGEHGVFGHSYATDIQEVGVPLVILAPGAPRGRSVPSAVSLRDLPATVLDLLGLPEASPFPGRSLAEYWHTPAEHACAHTASPALSEKADETVLRPPPHEGPDPRKFELSLVAPDGFQYIRTGPGVEHLYNLWRDPSASFDLIGSPEGDAMASHYRRLLLDALKENPGSSEVEDAYLSAYRQRLADLVQGSEEHKVTTDP